jgi:hypothetical protein
MSMAVVEASALKAEAVENIAADIITRNQRSISPLGG